MLISSTALPSASCSCLTADPLKAQLRASSSLAITVSAELCLCSLGAASPFWKLTSSLKWVWLERGAAAFSVFSLKDHKLKFKSLNGWLLAKLVIKQVCWDYKLQQQGWGNHLAFWSRPTLHIWNTSWGKMLMKSLPLLVTIKHPSTKYLCIYLSFWKNQTFQSKLFGKSQTPKLPRCAELSAAECMAVALEEQGQNWRPGMRQWCCDSSRSMESFPPRPPAYTTLLPMGG